MSIAEEIEQLADLLSSSRFEVEFICDDEKYRLLTLLCHKVEYVECQYGPQMQFYFYETVDGNTYKTLTKLMKASLSLSISIFDNTGQRVNEITARGVIEDFSFELDSNSSGAISYKANFYSS